jgi:hypothetical protein
VDVSGSVGRRAQATARTLQPDLPTPVGVIGHNEPKIEVPYPIHCNNSLSTKARTLYVYWRTPPSNRNIVAFNVRYILLPIDTDQPVHAEDHVIVKTREQSVNITNVLHGREYQIDVQSLDDRGLTSEYGAPIVCRTLGITEPDRAAPTRHQHVLQPPCNISALALNNTAVVVRWTSIDEQSERVRTYRVFIADLPDKIGSEFIVDGESFVGKYCAKYLQHVTATSRQLITSLKAGTYFVRVSSADAESVSDLSDVTMIDMPPTLPPSTPTQPISYVEGLVAGLIVACLIAIVCTYIMARYLNRWNAEMNSIVQQHGGGTVDLMTSVPPRRYWRCCWPCRRKRTCSFIHDGVQRVSSTASGGDHSSTPHTRLLTSTAHAVAGGGHLQYGDMDDSTPMNEYEMNTINSEHYTLLDAKGDMTGTRPAGYARALAWSMAHQTIANDDAEVSTTTNAFVTREEHLITIDADALLKGTRCVQV